jgi:BA14K-like protein
LIDKIQKPGVQALCSHHKRGGNVMRQFKLLGAVLVLGAATATPILAQEVITEPGYCAQYFPNANCQNLGPGSPGSSGQYYQRAGAPGMQASTGGSSACTHYRSYDPASGTYIGRNGRRIACQ